MEDPSLFVDVFQKLGYTRRQAQDLERLIDGLAAEGQNTEEIAAAILKYGEGAIREMRRLRPQACKLAVRQLTLWPLQHGYRFE